MAKRGERIDLTGQRFHWLTVVKFSHRKQYPSGQFQNIWECVCDCGNTCFVAAGSLRSDHQKSCGCKARELLSIARTKHGRRRRGVTPDKTWLAWRNMHLRCSNPKSDRFEQYGGRGITVDSRWFEFSNFIADMGDCPDGYSLERVDVNGNYCPSNCVWIPLPDQLDNKQNSIRITRDGETHCLAHWCHRLGLNYLTVYCRYQRGDRGDDLFRPVL